MSLCRLTSDEVGVITLHYITLQTIIGHHPELTQMKNAVVNIASFLEIENIHVNERKWIR